MLYGQAAIWGLPDFESSVTIQKLVWRKWVADLWARFSYLPLLGSAFLLATMLALSIPSDIRLLLFSIGILLRGLWGLCQHGAQKWDMFCRQVANQPYTNTQ